MAITLNGTLGVTSPGFEPTSNTVPVSGFYLPSANTVGLVTVSTERLRIDSSGNVGIGTSSPGQKLEVSGSAYITGGVSGQGCYLYRNGSDGGGVYGAQTGSVQISSPGANPITFVTNSAERMRLDSSGNLLVGGTTAYGLITSWTPQGGTSISALHGTAGSYPKASGISFGASSTALTVSNNGSTTTFYGGAGIYANNSAASNNPTDLVFWTTAGGSPTERARIDSSGRMTTPYQPAFFVFLNSTAIYSTVGTLPFTRVKTNIGSYYSTSTYRFTAPIAGTYAFYFKGFIESAARSSVNINVNDSAFQGIYGPQSQGDMIVANAIITLAANDYVTVSLRQGNVFGDGSGTNNDAASFSGYLLG